MRSTKANACNNVTGPVLLSPHGLPYSGLSDRLAVQAVGLQDKRDCRAEALSGGMKRKLQVALALLGSSRVILLGTLPDIKVCVCESKICTCRLATGQVR